MHRQVEFESPKSWTQLPDFYHRSLPPKATPMISADEILAVTRNVFSTMLDSDVEPADPVRESDMIDALTGCIRICGSWNGSIWIQCDANLASAAASAIFAIPEEEVGTDDRLDTIAELTNMIGGNIKSLMPAPSTLSLPTVLSEVCDGTSSGERVTHRVRLHNAGRELCVVLCCA